VYNKLSALIIFKSSMFPPFQQVALNDKKGFVFFELNETLYQYLYILKHLPKKPLNDTEVPFTLTEKFLLTCIKFFLTFLNKYQKSHKRYLEAYLIRNKQTYFLCKKVSFNKPNTYLFLDIIILLFTVN